MTSAGSARPAGQFLQTQHGQLFCLATPSTGHGCVVVAAPFAEEMNKCRRMFTLLGQDLAADGISLVVVDLHGTGESEGDFADARWEIWRSDLADACQWARSRGDTRIALLGVRLGALLAVDLAHRGELKVDHLLFWQPALSGQQHMNQFLRLKLAAGLRQSAATKETTTTLRERLARGERLEVAGYELAADLVAAIDGLDGAQLASQALPPIDWMEVSTSEPPALLPASERTLIKWRDSSVKVRSHVTSGEAFWALQEITVAPALNALTCARAREVFPA